MKLRFKAHYFLLLSLFLFGSCEEKIDSEAIVLTEDILFVSGEILRITGRVVASGPVVVSDHGFQIDISESFNSPIIISLGERDIPGRFIGSFDQLNSGVEYFVRAYMVIEGKEKVGDVLNFSTLSPEIMQYYPITESAGHLITISGRNLTADTEVYFGDQKGVIMDFEFESKMRIIIPSPVLGEFKVQVKVISDGVELVFDNEFEYIVGKWTKETSLPVEGLPLRRNTFFTANGNLYSGAIEADGANPNIYWKYDPLTKQWETIDYTGSYVKNPGNFEGGFLGGELSFNMGVYDVSNELWLLNANDEFELQGVTPFNLHRSESFRLGDDLYVFGGWGAPRDVFSSAIWKYSFTNKNWSYVDNAPIDIFSFLPSFSHNGLMYFITSNKRLFSYDPGSNSWEELASYPGEKVDLALGATIGDYAFVGLSYNELDIYQYEFATDDWTKKIPIRLNSNNLVLSWYVFDEKLYVLRGDQLGNKVPEMWVLEPFRF